MTAAIVLTVVAADKPGVVEALSRVIEAHGGNWTESSMMHLAGQFAGILLVHLPPDRSDDFAAALEALAAEGITVVARPCEGSGTATEPREFTIELVGADRPGIVREITEVLARHGVNVQELETTVQSASMSGELLFMAHIRLMVPDGLEQDVLQDDLEALANELMVDISLQD